MATNFEFDSFHLDGRARELRLRGEIVPLPVAAFDCLSYLVSNRDRPVGRDELISAVWGRADISESTLAHTIARVRQALGDNASGAQHYIRTVPRLGYRWMAVVRVAALPEPEIHQDPASPADLPSPTAADDAASTGRERDAVLPSRFRFMRNRPLRWALAAAAVATVSLVLFMLRQNGDSPAPDRSFDVAAAMGPGTAALVETARIEGGPGDAWMRLGVMDLIANRLRGGGIATLPSETMLSLPRPSENAFPAGVALRVRPRAARVDGGWEVTLETMSSAGAAVSVQARDPDAIRASRIAADRLLQALGRGTSGGGDRATRSESELLARVAAHRLGNDPGAGLALIDAAPATLRGHPAVRVARMRIVCDMGRWTECRDALDALDVDADIAARPAERANVMVSRAWFDINHARDNAAAGRALDEAIAMDERMPKSDALGNAYSLRGWLRYAQARNEDAMSDLGMARLIFLSTGNLREIARVDQRIGIVRDAQGQLVAALASLQSSARQFRNLGAESEMAVNRMAMSQVQSRLLQHRQAVDTIEAGWTPDSSKDPGLVSFRAWALMRDGRLAAAEALIASTAATGDGLAGADAAAVADARALMARIALARADPAEASRWATSALRPEYASADSEAYLENGLVAVRALLASGQRERAREVASQLERLSRPAAGATTRILLLQIRAERALADHRTDDAMAAFSEALDLAERLGVPDTLVDVAAPYVEALLAMHRLDEASRVETDISQWTAVDSRAAKAQAELLRVLGREAAARATERQASLLAGEGVIAGYGRASTVDARGTDAAPDRLARK